MSAPAPQEVGLWSSQYLRALRHRNFRLFFAGQLLHVSGTWMQRVAEGWLAYRLTESPFLLGLVAFAGSAPAVLLSPLAGVVADRVDRHRMLMVAQACGMMQAFLLALFTLQRWITPTQLVLFALVAGVINSFENPARQSFFVQLVSREDLMNAIALNATLVNTARIVGPASAGLIIAAWGEGFCFLLNSLTFMAVLVFMQLMSFQKKESARPAQSQWQLLREGSAYVRRTSLARSVLLLFAATNFAGAPYIALLPMFAGSVLRVGATGLGWLISASGLGALVVAIVMAGRSQPAGLVKGVLLASLTFGGALVGLSLSRHFYLSLLILPLIGGGFLLILAGTQTLLQSVVPDELRGRVMSFYSLVFLGFAPLGSLLEGWIAEHFGVAVAVGLGGAVCVGAGLLFARRLPELRAASVTGYPVEAAADACVVIPSGSEGSACGPRGKTADSSLRSE